jgi:phosphatidylglycerophosphate synthase
VRAFQPARQTPARGGSDVSGYGTALASLKNAQKSSSGAPAYSRFVNRPLGRRLAALAHQLGLSPTQVTLLSGTATATAILVIALLPLGPLTGVLASALLVLGYALDAADGQLARLTGQSSLAGEWLDHYLDAFKAVALHAAIGICWFRFTSLPDGMLLVPVVFAVAASTFFFGIIAADFLRRVAAGQGTPVARPEGGTRMTLAYSLVVLPADYGFLCLVIATLAWPVVFVPVYTTLAAANAALVLVAGLRWYRSLRALDVTRA